MIKAIIIDDEKAGRKLLQSLIKSHCNDIEIVAEEDNLPNGVIAIRKLKPVLVFLDIEMPGHNGLEIVDFFDENEINFGIIFTTAYSQYALKAFKLPSIDYLLKPIEKEDLIKAIDKFKRWYSGHLENPSLNENVPKNEKIAIPVGHSIRFVEPQDIIYIKAENTYSEVHLEDKTKLLVSRTLKNFEESLTNFPEFVRCHKSYIVNKQYVEKYIKSDGGYVVMKDLSEIPINPDSVEQLFKDFNLIKR